MVEQLDMFAEMVVQDFPKPTIGVDTHRELENLAFLYTSTEKGNTGSIRFMMSLEDARRWCGSNLSRGNIHGTNWAYFYTAVPNYLLRDAQYGQKHLVLSTHGLIDNGTWDERIATLGLKKIEIGEFSHVLEPLGVKVVAHKV